MAHATATDGGSFQQALDAMREEFLGKINEQDRINNEQAEKIKQLQATLQHVSDQF